MAETRVIALCYYRLHDLTASEDWLRSALALARQGGFVEQELLVHNHLGATVRRMGDVEAAYRLFKDALARAGSKGSCSGRCRTRSVAAL